VLIGRNTSRGTKSGDTRRPILLTKEKQERKSLFQVLTLQ